MNGFAHDPTENRDGPPLCDCGDDACTTRPVYTGPNTYRDEHMCADCAWEHDNREPPDQNMGGLTYRERLDREMEQGHKIQMERRR